MFVGEARVRGKGLILQPVQKPGNGTIRRLRITRKTCGKFLTLETKLRCRQQNKSETEREERGSSCGEG